VKIWHRAIIRENKIAGVSSDSSSSRGQNILGKKNPLRQGLVVEMVELAKQFDILLSFVQSTWITILQTMGLLKYQRNIPFSYPITEKSLFFFQQYV